MRGALGPSSAAQSVIRFGLLVQRQWCPLCPPAPLRAGTASKWSKWIEDTDRRMVEQATDGGDEGQTTGKLQASNSIQLASQYSR